MIFIQYILSFKIFFIYFHRSQCSLFESERLANILEDKPKETNFYITNSNVEFIESVKNSDLKRFKCKFNKCLYEAKNGNLNVQKTNLMLFLFNFGITESKKVSESTNESEINEYFRFICDFQGIKSTIFTKEKTLEIELLNGNIFEICFDSFDLISQQEQNYIIKDSRFQLFDLIPNNNHNDTLLKLLPVNFKKKKIYKKDDAYILFDFRNKEAIIIEKYNNLYILNHILYLENKLSIIVYKDFEVLIKYSITILKDGYYFLEFDDIIQALVKKSNLALNENEISEFNSRAGLKIKK